MVFQAKAQAQNVLLNWFPDGGRRRRLLRVLLAEVVVLVLRLDGHDSGGLSEPARRPQ